MELGFLYSLIDYPCNLYIALYLVVHIVTYWVNLHLWSAHLHYADPKLNSKYSAF